jgi:hypothetical protein
MKLKKIYRLETTYAKLKELLKVPCSNKGKVIFKRVADVAVFDTSFMDHEPIYIEFIDEKEEEV